MKWKDKAQKSGFSSSLDVSNQDDRTDNDDSLQRTNEDYRSIEFKFAKKMNVMVILDTPLTSSNEKLARWLKERLASQAEKITMMNKYFGYWADRTSAGLGEVGA